MTSSARSIAAAELKSREDAVPEGFPDIDVLLLDTEAVTARLAPLLKATYRVVASTNASAAREFLRRSRPAVVVTELQLADGDGVEICREAKRFPKAPTVLVTTASVDRVPDALDARCDGVLLKPFAPNLLFARIGRLMRSRGQNGANAVSTAPGTNRFWPGTCCPYCELQGVTSFEFASHRRAWYACGGCKKVWLGKRQE